jgi:hypothetical protein
MFDDNDIKIAGNRPSDSIKRNSLSATSADLLPEAQVMAAKQLGVYVAEKFSEASNAYSDAVEDADVGMFVQRILLLSFTVTAVFESELISDAVAGIAQKSFLDTVKKKYKDIYQYTSDTGAFTFYYLAFRRGREVERRMGQTFAMLCSHDGDPIYQELGEVLFCWFSSVVKDAAKDFSLIK